MDAEIKAQLEQLAASVQRLECQLKSQARLSSSGLMLMAMATGEMPGDGPIHVGVPPEETKKISSRAQWKYSGSTIGPRPSFGLWVPGGYVEKSTPECGWMKLNGYQRFVQLVDCQWMCAETFVQYWFNDFNLCG